MFIRSELVIVQSMVHKILSIQDTERDKILYRT